MFCPECRSEYVEGMTECVDCKVLLVGELPPESGIEYEYENFVTLRTYLNRVEAEFAHSVLEANQIEAFISSDDAGGSRPELTFLRGVKLLVHQKDVQRAEDLFKDLPAAQNEDETLPEEEDDESMSDEL